MTFKANLFFRQYHIDALLHAIKVFDGKFASRELACTCATGHDMATSKDTSHTTRIFPRVKCGLLTNQNDGFKTLTVDMYDV